jgi:hypothetical protein
LKASERPKHDATASVRNAVVKLLSRYRSALALGVGAVFGHKADRKAHWDDPPNWIADAKTDDASTGDP